MKRMIAIVLAAMMAAGLLAGCSSETLPEEPQVTKVAFVAGDTADSFQEELTEGMQKAAPEFGLEIVDVSPEIREDEQICQQIKSAVSSGYRAIIAANCPGETVNGALQEAADAGIGLVCVDFPSGIETAVSVVTDQKAAGRSAGEALMDVLAGKRITEGQIAVISASENEEDLARREEGFREVFAGTAYTLLDTRYGDRTGAQTIAEEYIAQEAVGIFCCDEDSTAGAGNAIKNTDARIPVIGFGNTDTVLTLVEEGSLRAAVMAQPEVMGHEAVKAAAALLQEEVPDSLTIDAGTALLKTKAPAVLNGDYRIALIAGDRISQDGIGLETGAMQAAADLGCQVMNLSPVMNDEAIQIQQIQEAAASGCHAIVIAPEDSEEILSALQEAENAGVKIICVGTFALTDAAVTVAADGEAAGRTAGERMIAELKARELLEGTIGVIGINGEDEISVQREAGFRAVFEGTGYTLPETRYSEGDAAKSHTIAEEYLGQNAAGIFCSSEGCTIGAGYAVRESKKEVILVGFGASDAIQEMIEGDTVFAALSSSPETMGYEGIKAACAALNGETEAGTHVDCGVTVLTK